MSKRFGRNQKRRMRAQLAQQQDELARLKTALEMNTGLLAHQSEKIAHYVQIFEDVRDVLGENHVALPVEELAIGIDDERDGFYVSRICDFGLCVDSMAMDVMSTAVMAEYMHKLLIHTESDACRNQMHVRVKLAGKVIGYSASETALMTAPSNYLERVLSREIAHELVRQIKGRAL